MRLKDLKVNEVTWAVGGGKIANSSGRGVQGRMRWPGQLEQSRLRGREAGEIREGVGVGRASEGIFSERESGNPHGVVGRRAT